MSLLDLTVKRLTGSTISIQISETAIVLDLKKNVSAKLKDQPIPQDVPYYRAKLISDYRGPGTGVVLDDDTKSLSSYSTVTNGSMLFLLVEKPFKIYVQDPESQIFEIEIPQKNPEMYTMSELRASVQAKFTGHSLVNYQFRFDDKYLEEKKNDTHLTLKDHGINLEDTVFVMRVGTERDIIQPVVDICFMMDCTGSMSSWIESVKKNIKTVRDRLDARYKGCDLRVSFVRYTDYDMPESNRTTWLDFTSSLKAFHTFVNPIVADGGGDGPEDIMGALKITLSKLNWRTSSAKVLIHIADAPCHGNQYHESNYGDNYPNGDPAGITHDQMMREVAHHDIQYWFGYINKETTDKMIGIFNTSLKQHSAEKLLIRQFNAKDPDEIVDAIHKSVTVSITATVTKKS